MKVELIKNGMVAGHASWKPMQPPFDKALSFVTEDIPTTEKAANIYNVSMLPAYRGLGYSKELLSSLINDVPPDYDLLWLTVDKRNDVAIALYDSQGFEKVATRASTWLMIKKR